MILADRIVELRKKKGWSQEELAEMINVTTGPSLAVLSMVKLACGH